METDLFHHVFCLCKTCCKEAVQEAVVLIPENDTGMSTFFLDPKGWGLDSMAGILCSPISIFSED